MSLTDARYRRVNQSPVLAMGTEIFEETETLDRAAPLRGAKTEVEEVARLAALGSEAYLGEQFTIETLKSRSPEFSIIHLATHANFDVEFPRNSFIRFHSQELLLKEFSIWMQEIGQLDSQQVELLILSACKTAVGNENAELGFSGFANQAGVKSVLASLWQVDDVATLGLMTKFYQEFVTNQSTIIKAEALRRAQVAMIEGSIKWENNQLIIPGLNTGIPWDREPDVKDFSNPHFWSGFTIVGNPW